MLCEIVHFTVPCYSFRFRYFYSIFHRNQFSSLHYHFTIVEVSIELWFIIHRCNSIIIASACVHFSICILVLLTLFTHYKVSIYACAANSLWPKHAAKQKWNTNKNNNNKEREKKSKKSKLQSLVFNLLPLSCCTWIRKILANEKMCLIHTRWFNIAVISILITLLLDSQCKRFRMECVWFG